jgi:hypothetical protein
METVAGGLLNEWVDLRVSRIFEESHAEHEVKELQQHQPIDDVILSGQRRICFDALEWQDESPRPHL